MVSTNHKVRAYIRYRPKYMTASPADNTWKHIAEVTNYGEIRKMSQVMRFEAVSRRYALKGKGSEDIGDWTVQYGYDYSDEGQDLLRAAREADFDFQFKLVLRDFEVSDAGVRTWTTLLWRAFVTDWALNPGGVNAWVMSESKIAVIPNTLIMIRPTKAGSGSTVDEERAETDDYPLLEAPYITDETGEED